MPVSLEKGMQSFDWQELLKKNIVPIVSILFLVAGAIAYSKFKFDLKGSTNIPFEIVRIESVDYEHLTFLATYIIPLICFDLNSIRYLIVLALLLITMGIIYIKTDLFYANPSLALLKFHIYKVDGNFKNGKKNNIVLLSRHKLSEKQKVSYIKLDERIYYVKPIIS